MTVKPVMSVRLSIKFVIKVINVNIDTKLQKNMTCPNAAAGKAITFRRTRLNAYGPNHDVIRIRTVLQSR